MKHLFPIVLSTAAICAVAAATPAAAQLAGNPGDQHTRTVYMQEYNRSLDQGTVGANVGLPFFGPLFTAQGPAQCRPRSRL